MARRRGALNTALCRKLTAALVAAGAVLEGDDDAYSIQRLYPGPGQRSGGAWLWSLDYWSPGERDSRARAVAMNIGSIWTVTELIKHGLEIEASGIGYKVHRKGY